MTSRSTWKQFEGWVCKLLGVHRTPLSGSSSRHTASDCLHDELYVEVKYKDGDILLAWGREEYDVSGKLAEKEGKVGPIIVFKRKGEPNDAAIAVLPFKLLATFYGIVDLVRGGGTAIDWEEEYEDAYLKLKAAKEVIKNGKLR